MASVRATVRVIRDIDVPFLFDEFDECVRCRVRAGSKSGRCLGMFLHTDAFPTPGPTWSPVTLPKPHGQKSAYPDRGTPFVLDKLRTVKSSQKSGKKTVKALGAHGNKMA